MAHVLRITDYNGTVEFNTGNQSLLSYVPRSPNLSTVDFTPEALRDGGERPSTTRRNVTESAVVLFGGTDTDAMRATMGSVEAYLKQAEHYQDYRAGSPVYVEFQPGGSGDTYRSELLSGKVELDDLTLSAGQWNRTKAKAIVAYTRRHYWEGGEATLQLYNSGGTSGSVTVYNCDDGTAGRDNYVEIAGTSVSGHYPTPLKLQMTPGGTALSKGRLYAGYHGIRSGLSALTHAYEATAARSNSGNVTATNVADDTCSGGSAVRLTWGTSIAVALQFIEPTQAEFNNYDGDWFNVFARFRTAPSSSLQLQLETYGRYWAGPWVTMVANREVQHVGVFRVPPYPGTGTAGGVTWYLNGKQAGGGSIEMDYLMFMPLIRQYEPVSHQGAVIYTMVNNDTLVDDPLRADSPVYLLSNIGVAKDGYVGGGQPIHVWPDGRAHRLYFIWDLGNGSAPVTETLGIQASYRPRRLTF